jgi:hypothetical protein
MKWFFLITLFVTEAFAQSQASYIPYTRTLRAKGYQIGVYNDSFTSQKYIDNDGKRQDFSDGYSFNRIQSEVAGHYGATNDLQFGLGFRYRRNQAKYLLSNEEITATGQGLQSTFASIMFAFEPVDEMYYVLEGTFRYTPYTNEEYDSTVDDPKTLILGDSGNEISAGVGMTYYAKKDKFLTLRGGYRRPGTDLSHEFYYGLEGALAWKYVALLAGVDGVSSLNNDPYEDDPAGRPILNTGGTRLYNSENREWVTPYVGLNFALGKTWRIELRGSQVVSGHSTDLGSAFGFNIIKRMDKDATRLVDAKFKSYDIEMNVTKVSPKKEYMVVDKGLADDIVKGMRIDFFEFDYIGGNVLVASGVVIKINAETSIVKITNRFNMSKDLKEGLIGRASLK